MSLLHWCWSAKSFNDMILWVSQVFGPEATNDRIFKRCVVSCLDTLCQGKSCTVMAYGEDTSGKSHSLMGSEEENGVIWYGTLAMRVLTCKVNDTFGCSLVFRMSLVYIFKAVQKVRGVQGISLSYYEIYNEVKVPKPELSPLASQLTSLLMLSTGPQRPAVLQRCIASNHLRPSVSSSHPYFPVLLCL